MPHNPLLRRQAWIRCRSVPKLGCPNPSVGGSTGVTPNFQAQRDHYASTKNRANILYYRISNTVSWWICVHRTVATATSGVTVWNTSAWELKATVYCDPTISDRHQELLQNLTQVDPTSEFRNWGGCDRGWKVSDISFLGMFWEGTEVLQAEVLPSKEGVCRIA